tara:strand:- start:7920 stop:8372 length:453 start_codon:yes stop_codon:yes gene_type:complete
VRVVVGVENLLFVPAVDAGTSEFDPVLEGRRGGGHRGKVAARAVLMMSVDTTRRVLLDMTYMLGIVRALLDVGAGGVGKLGVPDQILGAVQLAPIPVSTHDGADEGRVVLVRRVVTLKVAQLNLVCRRSNRRGSRESNKGSEDLHADVSS